MAILRKSTFKFLTCWALINYSFAPPFQHVPKTKYTFLEGKPSTKKSIIINFLKITSGSAHLCWKCKFRNFWDRNNISQNKTKNSIWFSFCQIRTFSFHVLSDLVFLLWINIITNDYSSISSQYFFYTSDLRATYSFRMERDYEIKFWIRKNLPWVTYRSVYCLGLKHRVK